MFSSPHISQLYTSTHINQRCALVFPARYPLLSPFPLPPNCFSSNKCFCFHLFVGGLLSLEGWIPCMSMVGGYFLKKEQFASVYIIVCVCVCVCVIGLCLLLCIRIVRVYHNFFKWGYTCTNICEFKASLVYKASARTARTVTLRNSVSKTNREYTIIFNLINIWLICT